MMRTHPGNEPSIEVHLAKGGAGVLSLLHSSGPKPLADARGHCK
jgi:hypothetical protein